MTGLRMASFKFLVVALASFLALITIYNTMRNDVKGGPLREYQAVFTDVSGLRAGDGVRLAGVQVGKVRSISVDGRRALVRFSLLSKDRLFSNTHLVMKYQNLLGQRFIAVEQSTAEGAPLAPGATIQASDTDPGFDLTVLLNGFKPLFDVLQPADINHLASTIVNVLQGEGGKISTLLRQTAQLTNFVADRDQVFDAILKNLTPVLQDLSGEGNEFDSTVTQLRALMTGLAAQRRSFSASVTEMSGLVGRTSALVTQLQQPTAALVHSLRNASQMFADNVELIKAVIGAFPDALGVFAKATSHENALNAYICRFALVIRGEAVWVPPTNGPYSKVCGG